MKYERRATDILKNTRDDDKKNRVRRRLSDYIKANFPHLYTMTGNMGVEFGARRRYFEVAKKASEKNVWQREKDIFWIPLSWQDEVIVVAGLKTKGKFPKEEADLLSGLLSELTYEEFLESQNLRMLDPKCEFTRDLLESDKFKSFEEVIDKGDILGINLRSPQAVILIEVPGLFKKVHQKHAKETREVKSKAVHQECKVLISRLSGAFMNYEQNIFACLSEEDMFVCLKWAKGEVNTLNTIKFFKEKAGYIREVVEKETKISPTIGVGQYYPGLAGLRKSYEDAKSALEIGKKIWGPGRNYHITDVGMFVALSSKIAYERKCELAFQILGPIFSEKDLYKTVNVFLENDMNLSEASKNLHLHRNTLIYRLDKIKKAVALDPRKFSDAVQIKLGLLLYSPEEKC